VAVLFLSYSGQAEEGNRGAFARAAKGVVVPSPLPGVRRELRVWLARREPSRSACSCSSLQPWDSPLLLCGARPMVAGAFPSLEWFPLTCPASTNLPSVCLRYRGKKTQPNAF